MPFFRQKRIISNLNVPRRYQLPVAILRALSFLPALFYTYHYWKAASLIPLRDAGGPRLIQITQAEYYVAILWVIKKKRVYKPVRCLTVLCRHYYQAIGVGY